MLQKLKKMQILWMIIFVMGIFISGKGTMKAMASGALQLNKEYKISELIKIAEEYSSSDYYFKNIAFPATGRARVVLKNTTKDILHSCSLGDYGQIFYDGIENVRSQWFSVTEGQLFLRLGLEAYSANNEARFILEYQTSNQYVGEIESNDTFDTANVIQPGLTYEGNLTSEDVDVYKFVMAQNGLALIKSSDLRSNNEVYLYKEDTNGNTEKIEQGPDFGRIRLKKGSYFIRYGSDGWQNVSSQEYTLKVDISYESDKSYEQEENNIISDANVKNVNVKYIGNLNDYKDIDWYKFTIDRKSVIALETWIPRESSGGVKFELYKGTDKLQENTTTTNPYNKAEGIIVDSGTYLLRVTGTLNEDYAFNLNRRDYIYVSQIGLDASMEIVEGTEKTLVAKISPDNADNKILTWSSSNPVVASVNDNGLVSGKKAGTTVITATATDGSGVVGKCNLTVKAKPIKATGISLPSEKTIQAGSSIKLTANVLPANATNRSVTWISDDESIATVDASGRVFGRKAGETYVVAAVTESIEDSDSDDPENWIYEICYITVKPKPVPKLNKKTVSVTIGKSYKLSLKSAKGKVTWKSKSPSIATVTSSGVVKGKKPGKATIVAKCGNKSYTCTVTVNGYFGKGTWYTATEGDFHLIIHSVAGNKMKYSIRMPGFSLSNKTATIGRNGKVATASFKCRYGKKHSLTFTYVNGNRIKIKETSSCSSKLLAWSGKYSKKTLGRSFYKENYIYAHYDTISFKY